MEFTVNELGARAQQVQADMNIPAQDFLDILLKEQDNQFIVQNNKIII